ncbi:MAG: methylenetetrahydrofolate reductase [Candidatus Omnitrophica bacterium]|nr:methylenetetrahydrofolate reductase [Candidatus Omnitrophota bacterium]
MSVKILSFKEKLEKGLFVWTTEVGPPKGVNMEPVFGELESVRGKVDAVNVTDQQSAVMRMGPIAAGKALIDRGYEPICQFTCRDRNRIALQSDLLSAYALGIRNILIMTGDHPLLGDHPQAKPVYDLDSITLLSAANGLEGGVDMAGKKLNASPVFYAGGVVNPGAEPLEPELIKMEKKISRGAKFFQTQAIFNLDIFGKFIEAIKPFRARIKLLGGIVPLRSVKMAEYMNANIPGVFIPDEVIERLRGASDIEKESVAISAELVEKLRPVCDGIHFMPIKGNHLVARILEKVGSK